MQDSITLTFQNRDANKSETMKVEPDAAPAIARWYGGYHGGDDYDVIIDGEIVEKDINGEI